MEIRKKSDLYNTSVEEIETFFKNVVFKGQYSDFPHEREDKRFCGKIEHITINGETNDLCPTCIFVPDRFSQYVKTGLCEFNALPNIKVLKDERHQYRLMITRVKNVVQKTVKRDRKAESTFRYNLKLKDDKFVGQFTENKDGSFTIRDIRRSDFSKLILQNGKEQAPIVYHPHLFKPKNGVYYEFSWILNGEKENYVYLFKVDETGSFQEVTPRNLIKRLHDDIMNYPAGAGQKIVRMLDTLKTQLTASGKEIFIYELLQNANDYPVTINDVKQKVDVEFHLTLSSLIFMHSGAVFNERNIAAICSINDKEKDTNKDTIGYKGIGFKTVFLDNENVYLQTGDYSFRFDRQATRDIVDTPWQILPIWTHYQELTPAERAIFTQASDKFRVKFALKPTKIDILRNSEHNYADMFQEIFKNERVILFIPNLSSVKVYLNGTPVPDIVCCRDNASWRVDEFKERIAEEITEAINSDIDEQEDNGALKIPTKYYNFNSTKVSFACEIDGRKLKVVKDTCLYCYLPAKDATWGLKFLMNTDMIPNGARDDVEVDFSNSINVNETIANIAGSKLFEWILKLTKSGEYELDSIYNLIPSFASLKSGKLKYKDLIDSFENGFVDRVKTDDLVPTQDGYVCLLNVIVDKSGLTSSGIISDEDFLNFSDNEEKTLPNLELRTSKSFESFAVVYLHKFDVEENIFDMDSLRDMIGKDDFQEWLKIQENNNKFLNFLLDKGYLKDFMGEKIFLDSEGELFCASDLYYDIDKYLVDLQAFTNHISYIDPTTREFFKDNDEWNKVIEGEFNEFSCNSFVDNVLLSSLNIAETNDKLKDKDTSIHFYKFLAENVQFCDKYKSLPFFDDQEGVADNFTDSFVFFSSEKGHTVCGQQWMSAINVHFLSKDYEEVSKKYFIDHFDVRNYSNDIVIEEIVLSEIYHQDIEDVITEIEDSKAFVLFCYENKALFKDGALKNYRLHVYDGNGDSDWVLTESNIFFQSSRYDFYSSKSWINCDWMYVLDEDYFAISDSKENLKDFFKSKFYVSDLAEENFYVHVVRANLSDIFRLTSGSSDRDGSKNIDFIHYLDDNFKMIFEEKHDKDKFKDFKPVSNVHTDLTIDSNVYVYDKELAEIISYDWFPDNLVYLCHKDAGNSRALVAMGCSEYNFRDFFDDMISEKISSINDTIITREQSVVFHSFVINHLSSLTPEQQKTMVNAQVFLYGHDTPASTSTGHQILSAKAKELFDKGFVDISDLDIIDPIYQTEKNLEYWETRLANSKFNITHFFCWLKENALTFSETLQDVEKNVMFWRWIKENATDSSLQELPALPVLLKDESIDDSDDAVYFSDEYMGDLAIESTVKRFDSDAPFISPMYITEGDSIEDWRNFWIKVGIKYEIVDILIETIRKGLENVEDESLPRLLADNRDVLEKHYENGLVPELCALKVKALDGQYYAFNEAIYIDCEKEEPFPYIELPNQIKFDSSEERRLIKDIIEYVDGDCVKTLSEWQQRKLDCCLNMQQDSLESVRVFHFDFINELSDIRNAGKDSLKELDHIEEILLLNKDGEFCTASELTMGSVYKPFFDFEACGIDSLEYVSDTYSEKCSEYVGRIFRDLKMHCDFQEDDINFLEERPCAIYFWSSYILKKDASIPRIRQFISDRKFDDVACIPTKDDMKCCCDLYYGVEVSKYVKSIEDWENKVPLSSLPDIKLSDDTTLFSKLSFKKSLDFLDALYALISIKGQDSRTQLLNWMIDDYDESFDAKIQEYRDDEHALWYNNKNELMQIKELYALDYSDKALEQYFGTNVRIINKAYFPAGESFKKACNILGIRTITKDDLKMEPVNDTLYTSRDTDLKLYALVIAGITDSENWKNIYEGYCERLNSLVLHRCKSILITYSEDKDINQSLRKFYHNDGENDFYFVDSLDGKRVFESFVKEYIKYLGINTEIDKDVIEDIMDSRVNALSIIKEQNSLMLDEEFKNELDKLIPGIKRGLTGNEAEDDEDSVSDYRPSFTTQETTSADDDTDVSPDDEEDSNNENEHGCIDSDEGDHAVTSSVHVSTHSTGSTFEPVNAVQKDSSSDMYSSQNVGWSSGVNSSPGVRKSTSFTSNTTSAAPYEYSDMSGWNRGSRTYVPQKPRPFSPEDVRNFGSHGVTRTLEVLEPTRAEVNEINHILGEDLSAEQVADQNYLAQLRLYNNLVKRGYTPVESKSDFIRNAHLKNEHTLCGGKYIHKCSAAGGIMYLSPVIWNKIADDRCVVCVYLGAKANEFMYFNSIGDILEWIGEDDIIIKLTGEEKAEVVRVLYSGVLNGVKGTAYTLIRINSNEKYNSLFAQLPSSDSINESEENDDDY